MSYRKKRSRKYWANKKYKKGKWHPYLRATAPALGYLAMKGVRKIVKQYVNTEFKYKDLAYANINMTDATDNTATKALNLLDIGTSGQSNRIGKQVKMTSVYVKGTIQANSTQDNRVVAELWLMKDVSSISSLPARTSLYDYDYGTSDTAISNVLDTMRNLTRIHNFKLLRRKEFNLDKDDKTYRSFKMYYRFKPGVISCYAENEATGSVSTMTKGLLFMTFQSNQSTSNFPTVSFVSRVRYIDN